MARRLAYIAYGLVTLAIVNPLHAEKPHWMWRRTIAHDGDRIHWLCFAVDGRQLASSSLFRLDVWRVSRNGELEHERTIDDAAGAIAISPDGKIIAANGRTRGEILLFDIETGKIRRKLEGASDTICAIAFSTDGSLLASCGVKRNVNPSTGSKWGDVKLWKLSSDSPRYAYASDREYQNIVRAIAFAPDSSVLASGDGKGSVMIWDARTWRVEGTFSGGSSAIYSVVFDPKGEILATGGVDSEVMLWEFKQQKRPSALGRGSKKITSLAYSHDAKYLAAGEAIGSDDGRICFFDVSTHASDYTYKCSDIVRTIAFAPDGAYLVGSVGGYRTKGELVVIERKDNPSK